MHPYCVQGYASELLPAPAESSSRPVLFPDSQSYCSVGDGYLRPYVPSLTAPVERKKRPEVKITLKGSYGKIAFLPVHKWLGFDVPALPSRVKSTSIFVSGLSLTVFLCCYSVLSRKHFLENKEEET